MWCPRCQHEITSPHGVCFDCTDSNDIVAQLNELLARKSGVGKTRREDGEQPQAGED